MAIQNRSREVAVTRRPTPARSRAGRRRGVASRPGPEQLGRVTWVLWNLMRATLRLAVGLDERVWRAAFAGVIVLGLLFRAADDVPVRVVETVAAVALAIMAGRPRPRGR